MMSADSDGRKPNSSQWLTRDVMLISLSAFFADMGYQAVTAVFPLLIVIELNEPVYIYGVLLALSYGVGSVFSLFGGKLGDRYDKKKVAIVGNLLIPLMSISALFPNVYLLGSLFVFGWWARYFRSPVRRAWLVEVSSPLYRSKIFGFLHALDVGGGICAVIYSITLLSLNVSFREIVFITVIPLLVSSASLTLAGRKLNKDYALEESVSLDKENDKEKEASKNEPLRSSNNFVFRAILLSATLFGFSYYALGFPILTVAQSDNSAIFGIITFGIYLGVSAFAGFLLGSVRGKRPFRTLWSLGYLVAAFSSLIIGLSYAFHYGLVFYYLGAAGLGFATGSVETFEPVLISTLVKSKRLSAGMGWLSSSRAIGLFVSNITIGALFVFSEFDSYLYAALTAFVAAMILLAVEIRTHVQ